MALVPHDQTSQDDRNDITQRLPSLQFESALTDAEKDYLSLRARSHAVTVSQCAQAAYFVNLCNKARRQIGAKRITEIKASKRIKEGAPRYDLKIGILGCGRLGSHLAVSLLTYGMVEAVELEISTRRPETLEYLQGKGVACFYDNIKLAERSDLLFFCVLPSQLSAVLDELKCATIKPTCLLYNFAASVTSLKIKCELNLTNIIKPDITWDPINANKKWDYTSHINTVLEQWDVVEKTSPLSMYKEDCVVKTSEKFSEMMIFAVANMLSGLRTEKWEVVDMINALVLGHTEDNPLDPVLVEEDFVKKPQDTVHYFPLFDLTRLTNGHTPVLRKLVQDSILRQSYQNVYCQVFQDYIIAQKYAPVT